MKIKTILSLAIAGFAILFVACHNYYMATPAPSKTAKLAYASTDSLYKLNRYLILRAGGNAYYISSIKLSEDQKTAACILDTLAPEHKLHLVNGRKGKMQYNKKDANDLLILSEVHIHIPQDNIVSPGSYTLQLDKVNKIEVIEKDKKRTTNSYVVGAVGYTLGAMAVAAVIIAATKSSCPFVSAYNQKDFSLQGEIYGGAIYPQLARHDFMPLKMSSLADGSFQVKISNELKERQYTDMADLWVITHEANTKVLADDAGNLYSISHPQSPVTAIFENKKDVTAALSKADDNSLLYFDDTTSASATNEVVIRFNKKAVDQKGKLILSLKNSYWLDYLYGKLVERLGTYYTTYMAQQKKKTATELLKWVNEQHIPLTVFVKTNKGWQKIKDLTTIGPLATREIVVPVDCAAITGNEVEIKLSSGFMFWEIDYAAMDFSADDNFTTQKLSPIKATDEQGRDVKSLLEAEDGQDLEQPQIGNVATLIYQARPPASTSQTQSFIFHSKGYYEHIREFSGKPDFAFLEKFTQPGVFAAYGKEMYKKVRTSGLQMLAANK